MKIKQGNDVRGLKYTTSKEGEQINFLEVDNLKVFAVNARHDYKRYEASEMDITSDKLVIYFTAFPGPVGLYHLLVEFDIPDSVNEGGIRKIIRGWENAFQIVHFYEAEDTVGAEFVDEVTFGLDGKSYYTIWLKYHEGTEEEMIAWHRQPAVDAADELLSHPLYIGADHYVYAWDHTTQSYNKTEIYVKGDAFSIAKTYLSVAAMEADFEGTDTKPGDFVLIESGDVDDPDNSKLYVKGSTGWGYLTDLSGAIGFTGKTPQFSIGTVTTGAAGSDVAVTLSEDGIDANGNPKFKLNFAIPQGATGPKGDPFTYADFTPEQIATLQQPATQAALLLETEVSNVSTISLIKIIDENTVLATGDGQGSFVVPEELNGCEIFKVHAAVSTPSSSGLPTFQLRTLAGNDILSTKVSIDQGAYTSYAATTPPIVNPTYKTVSTGDILFPDVDIAGTGAKGARLIITFKHPSV